MGAKLARSEVQGGTHRTDSRPRLVSSTAPTIKDVARAAGVSVSTVSHVFHETRPVASATEQRVRAAIEELGYRPSRLARALKGDRTGTIGMLATSSTNPFFAQIIASVEQHCFERGFNLILCNTGDDFDRLTAHLATLLEKRIDGLLVLTTNADRRIFDELASTRPVRVVAIDTDAVDGVAVVNDDSVAGGAMAAGHLIERGFRNIGVLTGPPGHPRCESRLVGFTDALAQAGLSIAPEHRVTAELTVAGGHEAMGALLARGARPDALFCHNDLMAIGALCALSQAGLSAPKDMSIIGYDDIEMAAYTSPPLTTVRQPSAAMGQRSADLLIGLIDGTSEQAESVALAPELVERASVGYAVGGAP